MSYSFSAKAATKALVLVAIAAKLDEVVVAQPVHAVDRDQALASAKEMLSVVEDDPAREISVSVHGSVWKSEAGVQSVSLGVSVSFAAPAS